MHYCSAVALTWSRRSPPFCSHTPAISRPICPRSPPGRHTAFAAPMTSAGRRRSRCGTCLPRASTHPRFRTGGCLCNLNFETVLLRTVYILQGSERNPRCSVYFILWKRDLTKNVIIKLCTVSYLNNNNKKKKKKKKNINNNNNTTIIFIIIIIYRDDVICYGKIHNLVVPYTVCCEVILYIIFIV